MRSTLLLAVDFVFFFFNDTATTEIYTLSLHDALPISSRPTAGPRLRRAFPHRPPGRAGQPRAGQLVLVDGEGKLAGDRKSTRLNSSHLVISYAVFCLKKKKIAKTGNAANAAASSTTTV